MTNPIRAVLVLLVTIFAIVIGLSIATPMASFLGDEAKSSTGSNGQGFSVSNERIDSIAKMSLVHVPAALLVGIGAWMFVSMLMVLAYRGVV